MLHCYPQPGKGKALEVCRAFAAGCNGQVVEKAQTSLLPGAAAFYGVRPQWSHLWSQAKAEGRDWFYIDNGYIGAGRFRVAKNAVQAVQCHADYDRLAQLKIKALPWRDRGNHVLVCPQSSEFMATVAGFTGDIAEMVRQTTDRTVVVRHKGSLLPLQSDLRNCWCVVTWSSNAAIEAIISGVPAIVLGESAAADMGGSRLDQIDDPPMPYERQEWLARLAASQWTLDEIRSGLAWRALTL